MKKKINIGFYVVDEIKFKKNTKINNRSLV